MDLSTLTLSLSSTKQQKFEAHIFKLLLYNKYHNFITYINWSIRWFSAVTLG